ncbi:MAG: YkgJ family cysteine cluster protein [Bryobacteraceae bacterium]
MTNDAELVQIVDSAVADAVRKAGDLIACRRGCTHCCIGSFAVTERDLDRLRVGLEMAPGEHRERVARRSQEAREAMREGFPGDWRTGRVAEQHAADAFDLRHPWLPCPVLDLETGACSLHAWRPVACRLHGPALRMNGVDLQPCRLNYTGVDAAGYRVSFTTPEAEESALTYIAWAVLESESTVQVA